MPPRPDSTDLAPEEGSLQLRFSTWSIVRAVLIVVAGIAIVGVVGAASTALWWLAIAATLAGLFQPAVLWLKHYMPAWVAIIVVVLGVTAIVGLVGYRGYAEMNSQFEILRANAVESAQDIQSSTQFGQVASEFGLVEKTKSFFDHLPVVFGGSSDKAAETVQSAASSGSSIFAIVTFALLLLIFGPRLVLGALAQIEDETVRHRITGLVVEAYHRSSRYVWLMAVRAVVVGVVGGIVCKAIGLQTPTALGVAFAIFSLVPSLGIVMAALPVAVSVAITSVPTAVALVVVAVVLQGLDVLLVQRRIDESSVHVGPAASLVAALVGLQLYGLGGVMVAVAFTVYGMAVFRALTSRHDEVLSAVRSLVGDEDVEDLEGEPVESVKSVVSVEREAESR
jgi:predicted PurR-regulated permease PerM